MDYFIQQAEKLAKQASEITMYDINSAVNKAKNMVLNLSEIETKVREATNDDAWGASSTVMQEIAQATFNFQLFNEIMPTIYQRFTEKEARQWRQIYKSLVLLEYLVKNGSERVIDDARTHLSLIKVLRNFHYTDDAGKDQGINVRNRSKELAELLGDLDRVRQERRKAKANRNKYTGVGNDGSGGGGPSFTSASGSRYGGFGSDSMEGGGGGGGSSGGGGRSSGFNDHNQQTAEYEEYDAGDWEDSDRRGNGSSSTSGGHNSNGARAAESRAAAHNSRGTSSSSRSTTAKSTPAPPAPLPPKQKEVNLFDFDDEEQQPAVPAKIIVPEIQTANLDDDFDDFQSASPIPSTTSLPPKNVFDLLKANQQQQSSVPLPSYQQQSSLSSFTPLQAQSRSPINTQSQLYPQPSSTSSSSFVSSPVLSPSMNSRTTSTSSPAPSTNSTTSAGGAADFSDLFSSFNISSNANTGTPKPTIAQLSAKTNQDKLFAASSSSKPNNNSNNGAGSMSGWDSLI